MKCLQMRTLQGTASNDLKNKEKNGKQWMIVKKGRNAHHTGQDPINRSNQLSSGQRKAHVGQQITMPTAQAVDRKGTYHTSFTMKTHHSGLATLASKLRMRSLSHQAPEYHTPRLFIPH